VAEDGDQKRLIVPGIHIPEVVKKTILEVEALAALEAELILAIDEHAPRA
jgi:hypothetical protein